MKIDLRKLRELNNLKQKDLAEYLGLPQSFLSQIEKGDRSLPEAAAEKLLANTNGWVISESANIVPINQSARNEGNNPQNLVSLIPTSAHGGSLGDYSDPVMAAQCEKIVAPVQATYAIRVTGESMAPEYPSGSVVLVRKVNEKVLLEWGSVYVLDTTEGAVIKEIRQSPQPHSVECWSLNPDPKYASYTLDTDYIRGWYKVLMVMSMK